MIKFSKEIQIGLVAVVGVVVLYFGLQFLKGLTMFSSDSKYFVKFDNITGLSASSPVYANGFRVGVVENIIYDYEHQDHIVAVVGLNKEMRLPKGSTAEIVSDLLGNIKLELVMGPNPIRVNALQAQLGLNYGIENFWISCIVQFGVIHTVLLTIGLICLFVEILKRANPAAWAIVLLILVIASSSVSFSSKNIQIAQFIILITLLLPRDPARITMAQRGPSNKPIQNPG